MTKIYQICKTTKKIKNMDMYIKENCIVQVKEVKILLLV